MNDTAISQPPAGLLAAGVDKLVNLSWTQTLALGLAQIGRAHV